MAIVIKNQCCSCGKEFKNSFEYYKENGNYCPKCCEKINLKMKWKRLKRKAYLRNREEKKFNELTKKLKRKWKIDMEIEMANFKKWKERVYENLCLENRHFG